jgi:hypothetical protein
VRTSTLVVLIVLGSVAFGAVALAGVIFLGFLVARAQNGPPAPGVQVDGGAVTATDGRCRLRLLPGWSVRPDLENDEASIKVADTARGAYLIVLTDEKADFADDLTPQGFSDITRAKLLKNLDQPTVVAGPRNLVVNGRSAVQYEIHGTSRGSRLKLAYLHTAVDGEHTFHQVVAWTILSKLMQNRAALEAATNGLTDVP